MAYTLSTALPLSISDMGPAAGWHLHSDAGGGPHAGSLPLCNEACHLCSKSGYLHTAGNTLAQPRPNASDRR